MSKIELLKLKEEIYMNVLFALVWKDESYLVKEIEKIQAQINILEESEKEGWGIRYESKRIFRNNELS